MAGPRDYPEIPMQSAAELHAWLATNHRHSRGFWLVSWRSQTGRPRIDYEDVVAECLIHGWIDSTIRTLDAERSALRLTPRRRGSGWSASNKRRLEGLLADGRMSDAGLAAVEEAKRDRSFWLLDDVEALAVPDDLAEALGPDLDTFNAFTPGRRRQALYWVQTAKRDTTRSDRIARIVAAARVGSSLF